MKKTLHAISRYTTSAFVAALATSFGTTLVALAAAHLDWLITAWLFWYLSVLGFTAMLLFGIASSLSWVGMVVKQHVDTHHHDITEKNDHLELGMNPFSA